MEFPSANNIPTENVGKKESLVSHYYSYKGIDMASY